MAQEKPKTKSKKRKRKAPKTNEPVPTVGLTRVDDRTEMIEKLYLHISSIEVQVRAIKRLLLEYA